MGTGAVAPSVVGKAEYSPGNGVGPGGIPGEPEGKTGKPTLPGEWDTGPGAVQQVVLLPAPHPPATEEGSCHPTSRGGPGSDISDEGRVALPPPLQLACQWCAQATRKWHGTHATAVHLPLARALPP